MLVPAESSTRLVGLGDQFLGESGSVVCVVGCRSIGRWSGRWVLWVPDAEEMFGLICCGDPANSAAGVDWAVWWITAGPDRFGHPKQLYAFIGSSGRRLSPSGSRRIRGGPASVREGPWVRPFTSRRFEIVSMPFSFTAARTAYWVAPVRSNEPIPLRSPLKTQPPAIKTSSRATPTRPPARAFRESLHVTSV